jgi:6-phosphogluconolactonase (cycloisomerase 2 family)
MKNTLTRAMTYFAAAAVVAAGMMMTAGAAMAQSGNTCVYANDDIVYYNGPNTVDGYLVTATSQIYISPFQTGGEAQGLSLISDIIFNPTKNILYASDSHSGDVAAMRVNPATCQLIFWGNFRVGGSDGEGIGLAVSPNGKWLYVARVQSAEVNVLAIRNDGSLTGISQTIPLLNKPSSMAVSPDSTTLLVGVPAQRNTTDELISYSIDPLTGMLTQASIVSPLGNPGSVSIDSSSKLVYVDEPNSEQLQIGLLEIGPGSTLTFTRTYDFTEVGSSSSLGSALLSNNNRYLYVTNYSFASVTTLAVNKVTGALRYVSTASYGIENEDRPIGLASAKNGSFVFAGEPNVGYITHMGIFVAGKDGSLTSLGTFPISEASPAWIAATAF